MTDVYFSFIFPSTQFDELVENTEQNRIFYGSAHASIQSGKIKSAATEVTAQKTQTPIVAKLTQCETDVAIPKLKEFAFLSNPQFKYGKISVVSKKKIRPISHLLS